MINFKQMVQEAFGAALNEGKPSAATKQMHKSGASVYFRDGNPDREAVDDGDEHTTGFERLPASTGHKLYHKGDRGEGTYAGTIAGHHHATDIDPSERSKRGISRDVRASNSHLPADVHAKVVNDIHHHQGGNSKLQGVKPHDAAHSEKLKQKHIQDQEDHAKTQFHAAKSRLSTSPHGTKGHEMVFVPNSPSNQVLGKIGSHYYSTSGSTQNNTTEPYSKERYRSHLADVSGHLPSHHIDHIASDIHRHLTAVHREHMKG